MQSTDREFLESKSTGELNAMLKNAQKYGDYDYQQSVKGNLYRSFRVCLEEVIDVLSHRPKKEKPKEKKWHKIEKIR